MKEIWKETINIGIREASTNDGDGNPVAYDERVDVKATAWLCKKTGTLRIDLETIRTNTYEHHHAEAMWDEHPPQRVLQVLEPMKMPAIYRLIAGVIDDYETEATTRYLAC